MDSARNTPANYHAGTPSDPATDVSVQTRFYAKLIHNSYRDLDTDRPSHIVSQANADLYREDTWGGTIKSMSGFNESERRAVYYKRAIQSSDIATMYLPIDRDRDELLPIYLSIRGTYDIWDVFKDVNFLLNYGTGSTLNLTGYTSKLNQLFIDVTEAMSEIPNHPLVITSHSLGSKYALDLWKNLFNQPNFSSRLHKNVMFNPFLIIDDDYSLFATYPPLFKNTIEAHIIDGDLASIVYKNHPINPTGMTIYANVVDRDANGWINSIYDLTYASSLDVRNHQLMAFTDEVAQYPITTNIAYIADPSERRIRSVRGYNMTSTRPDGSDQSYTNQAIYLEYDSNLSPPQYLGNNPVMESTNMDFYDLQFQLGDIRDMIYRHDQWSFPMYLDIAFSRDWYLFRTGFEANNEIAYYLGFAAQPNELSYLRTYRNNDYTNRFVRQEHNLEKAYETITEAQLTTVISDDPNFPSGAEHLRTQWFVSLPPIDGTEPHSSYGTGERRTLSDLTQNPHLPTHGNYYRIRHSYLSGRVLGILRQQGVSGSTNTSDEGYLTLTYPGNSFETAPGTTMNTIFQCYHDTVNDLYAFLDIKYLDDNTTIPGVIDTAKQVYIGESNVHFLNWVATTADNHTMFQLLENTPENVNNALGQGPYTTNDYFLMRNTGNSAYIFVNDAWSGSDPSHSDYRGSLDPITYNSAYNPDYWGLWKFEEVQYP